MAHFAFNANDVTPSQAFAPVPAAKYPAIIEASEIKPTSAGTGKRLNLTFSILGGEFNNRKIFEGLNIENPNSEAQRISLENLSAICHAVGVTNLTNTEQLHNKPLIINVKIKPAQGEYDAKNVIKGYEAASNGGAAGGGSGGAQRPAAQRPQAATQQRPAAQQARPQAQQAPAQGAGRPQLQGRPQGAGQPVRQAPVQQVEQHVEQFDDQTQGYGGAVQDFGNDGGEFSGGEPAPWDAEG